MMRYCCNDTVVVQQKSSLHIYQNSPFVRGNTFSSYDLPIAIHHPPRVNVKKYHVTYAKDTLIFESILYITPTH